MINKKIIISSIFAIFLISSVMAIYIEGTGSVEAWGQGELVFVSSDEYPRSLVSSFGSTGELVVETDTLRLLLISGNHTYLGNDSRGRTHYYLQNADIISYRGVNLWLKFNGYTDLITVNGTGQVRLKCDANESCDYRRSNN